jgi:hypothetical protein
MVEVTVDTIPGADHGTAANIAEQLADVLHRARARGFVIDVRLVPAQPLAMGNYRMVGNVRPVLERGDA